jgi:hypothetical protein
MNRIRYNSKHSNYQDSHQLVIESYLGIKKYFLEKNIEMKTILKMKNENIKILALFYLHLHFYVKYYNLNKK